MQPPRAPRIKGALVNTFLAEQRTRWWRSVLLHEPDDCAAAPVQDLDAAIDLRAALDSARGLVLDRAR